MSQARNVLISWLQREASRSAEPGALLMALCQRLVAAGVPLRAATLTIATLHPLVAGSTFAWQHDRAHPLEAPRLHRLPDDMAGSPLLPNPEAAPYAMGDGQLDLEIAFSDGACQSLSLAVDPPGFDRAQRALLRRVARLLAAPLEILVARQTAATLLTTYLGRRSSARVLAGAVQRGDGETINAVLWYSDLRGFTALSESLPRDHVIALLNAHFERLAAPIKAFGGEVLKFMGDGILAIFPTETAGATAACNQALRAARGARAGMAALNSERLARGESALAFGLALHLGDVMYGNIGAPDRLDFTVIGPTVNLASRLEALCKPLDRPVLASAAFAEACSEALTGLGSHTLPDIGRPEQVYTLPELAPSARTAATGDAG
jgi:class 3 adenylate cyclase